MRIAALIFGLLGAAGSGFLGVKWMGDLNERKAEIERIRQLSEAGDPIEKGRLADINRVQNGAYALIASAVLAAIGCVLVLNRKGTIAGAMFLLGFIAPLALVQDGKLAIFTFGLALAALFAFFVKPAPVPKRAKDRGIPADTDMVG